MFRKSAQIMGCCLCLALVAGSLQPWRTLAAEEADPPTAQTPAEPVDPAEQPVPAAADPEVSENTEEPEPAVTTRTLQAGKTEVQLTWTTESGLQEAQPELVPVTEESAAWSQAENLLIKEKEQDPSLQLWRIRFLKDGTEVQPAGPVTVSLTTEAADSVKTANLYFLHESGNEVTEKTLLAPSQEGTMAVNDGQVTASFQTMEFGLFALVTVPQTQPEPAEEAEMQDAQAEPEICTLTLQQEAVGNMADPDKAVAFTVSWKPADGTGSQTSQVSLKSGQKATLEIPAGADVTIVEADLVDTNGYEDPVSKEVEFSQTQSGWTASLTMSEDRQITVENRKEQVIPTGIRETGGPAALFLLTGGLLMGAFWSVTGSRRRDHD